MASKIQLRRDLASSWSVINPILAQGEPGAELDTGKMKLGDGATPWNQLPYTSSNDYEDKFVFLFSDDNRYAGGVSTSRDGLHWTAVDVTSEHWSGDYNSSTYAYDLAVGNGRVAYLSYNHYLGRDLVLFSETPGSAMVDPNLYRYLQENGANAQRAWTSGQDFYNYFINNYQNQNFVTLFGPHGEDIYWHRIKFQGGYFIAIGSYYDSDINDDRDRPYFAYSLDAVNWTRGYVDLGFITTKMNAYADPYSYSNLYITDVNYNGSGWLFNMHYEWNTHNNNSLTGAFYMTDLSNGFNSDTYFPMNGAYSMNFDGQGWGGYMGNGRMIFSSNTDPRLGGWREISVNDAQQSVWGDEAQNGWNNSRSFIGGPLADGTPMFMVMLSNGRVLTTTDQGNSFGGSTPAAKVDGINGWTKGTTTTITTANENGQGYNGPQLIVIENTEAGYSGNGTYYANRTASHTYQLFHDFSLNNPVNSTYWGGSNNDGRFNNATVTFTQLGIQLDYPTYGAGKFVAFSDDNANNYMTQDGVNWTYGFAWDFVNSSTPYFNAESIAYGRVSTDGQIVVNDTTFPGGANSLTVGNNFEVTVSSGNQLAVSNVYQGSFSQGAGVLSVRPYNAQWRIGTYGRGDQEYNSGSPYTFIGADDYFDYYNSNDYSSQPAEFPGGPDIRLTTTWGDWYFTQNHYLSTGTTNSNQLITPTDADIVNDSQESFLKDIPRVDLGNSTAYTLQWSDRGRFLWFDGTQYPTNPTVTIPAEADVNFPIGTRIQMVIAGSTSANAWVQVDPASGVTLRAREDSNSPGSGNLLVRSDTLATLIKVDTNYWILSGPYLSD